MIEFNVAYKFMQVLKHHSATLSYIHEYHFLMDPLMRY